jgi:hypothetical protein
LVRTALGHGKKPFVFCRAVWKGTPIWNRDIDSPGLVEVYQLMAERMGVSVERAAGTTMRAFEGEMFETCPGPGGGKWVMPVGVYNGMRRGFGYQFCPLCLWEDEIPYFRRTWRFAWVTVCLRHGQRLRDRCPDCGQPVTLHRAPSIATCFNCGTDYREAEGLSINSEAMALQTHAETVLDQGWAIWCGWAFQRPFLYFQLLHRVSRVLCGRRSLELRSYVADRWGGDPSLAERLPRAEVEYFSAESRHKLMQLAFHLMADWPERFIEACNGAGIWWSWARKCDVDPDLPFAFAFPLKAALYNRAYLPNEDETRSAVLYLIKIGKYPSRKRLLKILGTSTHLKSVVRSLGVGES